MAHPWWRGIHLGLLLLAPSRVPDLKRHCRMSPTLDLLLLRRYGPGEGVTDVARLPAPTRPGFPWVVPHCHFRSAAFWRNLRIGPRANSSSWPPFAHRCSHRPPLVRIRASHGTRGALEACYLAPALQTSSRYTPAQSDISVAFHVHGCFLRYEKL